MPTTIYDLTHEINTNMLVYPGTPPVQINRINTLEQAGFRETQLVLTSHVGTHLDAPAHLLKTGRPLDQFPPEKFWGQAFFINCLTCREEISLRHLQPAKDQLATVDFVILVTGHGKKWPDSTYLGPFPTLTREAAEWLVQHPLKAVGTDTISIDRMNSRDLPIHHIFLEKEVLIIENIKIPEALIGRRAELVLAPLKFNRADGATVRILAKREEK